MPDPLYLSLWFASFEAEDMLPRALAVMQEFPYSPERAGISYLALHPVSWDEATVLEQRFRPGIAAAEAAQIAFDLLHEDYAYVFEAFWDLWIPAGDDKQWVLQPSQVRFLVHGLEFDEGTYKQDGHIQVDFGFDTLFLREGVSLNSEGEARVRANVQKLVEFASNAQKKSGASGRLLWSESDENFAQRLISRLQKVQ